MEVSRHHLHPLDHRPNQVPPLLEVGLRPERTGMGVQDDALPDPGVDHGVEGCRSPASADPDRLVPPLGQDATDVEVVIEGLEPALHREIGERATHRPIIASGGLRAALVKTAS